MPNIKYKGKTQLMNNCIGIPKELVNGESYDIDIKYRGQTIMVNNQPVQDPNGYYLIVFKDGTTYPYNKECVERHWSVNLK